MATAYPPGSVLPMLATPGTPPAGAGWGVEFKWDGVRAIVDVEPGQVRVASRNGRDVSSHYPELAVLGTLDGLGSLLLDGEIVALDSRGRPDFERLQRRMHVRRPSGPLVDRIPVTYYAFDLLDQSGHPLFGQAYQERRWLLDQLGLDGRADPVRVPPAYLDTPAEGLLGVARDHRLEGVVAKRLASRYHPGRRSPDWIKTALLHTQEVLVAGWRPGEGRRGGLIGSLVLGAHDEHGRLVYLGNVGTGFTEPALRELARQLAPLRRPDSPFDQPVPADVRRNVNWVRPHLVGEVAHRAWTSDGRLRHCAWRGLRPDREPAEVRTPDLP